MTSETFNFFKHLFGKIAMIDFVGIISSAFWIGLCYYSVIFFDLVRVAQESIYYLTMQIAIGCYAVVFYNAIKVIFIIPRRYKVPQINPDNYRKYAKKEIELATISGITGFCALVIALWTHLHFLTPILVLLYTIGFINVIKWF